MVVLAKRNTDGMTSHVAPSNSLERNEPRRMGGTNTWSTVLDRLVTDGEFGQVMSNHLRLYFYLVEGFTIVDSNDASDHLWNDDHIAQVSSDWFRFLTRGSLPFLIHQEKKKIQ